MKRDIYALVFDGDRKLCSYSTASGRRFRLDLGDIGRGIGELAPLIGRVDLEQLVDRAAESGEAAQCEIQSDRGQWFALNVEPCQLAASGAGVAVTLLDISHIRDAENRAAHMSAIVESSADAIVGYDLNGNVLSWNEGATRLYGYSPQQAIGRQVSFIVPDARLDELREIWHQLRDGQRIDLLETIRLRADSTKVAVSLSVSPIKDAAGQLIGVSSISRDISARKLTEKALKMAEKKYEDLYDNAPDMYATVDAQTGRVIDCNDTMLKALGLGRNEIVGRPMVSLYHPDSRTSAERAFRRFLGSGEVRNVELRILCGDGRPIDVSLSATAMRSETGRILRSRSVLRDITRRKIAEAKVREAVARRDEFLAMLSHELRNPLGAVVNACRALRRGSAAEAIGEKSLDVIQRQSQQMSRLLDDLLDVSRIVHGKVRLHKEPLDLRAVIGEAIVAAEHAFQRAQVDLTVDGDDSLFVDGDAARLQQLVMNLLTNAAKYTPAGGNVRLAARGKSGLAILTVADTGVGMCKAVLQTVFDPFVQESATADRSEGGMGIGLALVRSIAELHGGSVSAQSAGKGKGSTFTLRLPALPAPPERAPSPPVGLAADGRRVLIIEDNRDNREMLRNLLALDGFEVEVAEDGERGIEAMETVRPDFALVDIGLPGIDGYQVARTVCERQPSGRPLLIALTGYGRPEDRRKVIEAGFDEHLVKPLDIDRLSEILSKPR